MRMFTFSRPYITVCLQSDQIITPHKHKHQQDVFNRPVGSAPGGHILVMERVSTDG